MAYYGKSFFLFNKYERLSVMMSDDKGKNIYFVLVVKE